VEQLASCARHDGTPGGKALVGLADTPTEAGDDGVVQLAGVVRRVVAARVRDPHLVDDLVQETLTRVVASRDRVEGADLEPYAVVTARNLVATHAERSDRARRNAHRLVDVDVDDRPVDGILREEDRTAMQQALARLPDAERALLVAHEIDGETTAALAEPRDSTPGAVAAQLARIRAKLRVEYLLVQEQVQLPTDRCRPVLRAISAGDRRRQRELDAGGHLLGCGCCARLGTALGARRASPGTDEGVRVPVSRDADVVEARQRGREVAAPAGFSATDCTIIATAISEVARNIVKFARRGEVVIDVVHDPARTGVTVVARDAGPGIPDIQRALRDGFSTYQGLGLGLPGCRRLMDDFDIESEVGVGTTVTMTKWQWQQSTVTMPRRTQEEPR
jgi:RNA polymerase sigma factor (sigma-70 family)